MTPYTLQRGGGPVLLAMPHTGTWLPPQTMARLNPRGQTLSDTDWHIERLYDGLLPGATILRANFHRYVIDANRPPDDASLYPGQNTTGLVPLTDFDGNPIWTEPPSAEKIAARLRDYHEAYHAVLAEELARIREQHGVAILYDCHSIRSHIPRLFDGILPDFNIGTADGTSCAPAVEAAVLTVCARCAGYSHVVNGRFKGGWTTRHYGRPSDGIHAIQMELAQSTHLAQEVPPFAYDEDKAARLRPILANILHHLAELAPSLR